MTTTGGTDVVESLTVSYLRSVVNCANGQRCRRETCRHPYPSRTRAMLAIVITDNGHAFALSGLAVVGTRPRAAWAEGTDSNALAWLGRTRLKWR